MTITPDRAWVIIVLERSDCEEKPRLFRVFTNEATARSACDELNTRVEGFYHLVQKHNWYKLRLGRTGDPEVAEAEAVVQGIDPHADLTTEYSVEEVPLESSRYE